MSTTNPTLNEPIAAPGAILITTELLTAAGFDPDRKVKARLGRRAWAVGFSPDIFVDTTVIAADADPAWDELTPPTHVQLWQGQTTLVIDLWEVK
jgi:hypothetical protein